MRPRERRRQRAREESRELLSPIVEMSIPIEMILQCGLGDWAEGPVLLDVFPRSLFMAVEPIHRYCHEAWAAGFRGPIIQGLLWNETGLKKELNDWRTRTSVHDPSSHGLGTIAAHTVTLDDAVAWCGLPEGLPTLLWMDCEGAELEILKGATTTLQNTLAIICELKRGTRYPEWPEADNVIAALDGLGYEMVKNIAMNGLFLKRA